MEKSVKYALLIALLGLLFLGLTSCEPKDEPTEKATITITSDKDLTVVVVDEIESKIITKVTVIANQSKTFTVDMPDSRKIRIDLKMDINLTRTTTIKVNNQSPINETLFGDSQYWFTL